MRRIAGAIFSTFIIVVWVVLSGPGTARAGDFMDTRLTWTFGDDDFLKDAGEKIPDSPLPGIGDRSGYQMFMDNLNTKTKGRENLTHIVLYKKMPGFLKGVTTEAGLVVKLDIGALNEGDTVSVASVLDDDGSYLRAAYSWDEAKPDDGQFDVTFFPFDTERFRMGYLWDISWGGGNIFTKNKSGPAPGFKVGLKGLLGRVGGRDGSDGLPIRGDLWVGMKTAKVKEIVQKGSGGEVEDITVNETNYGILAGGGLDLLEWLRLDLGFGYFQQGKFQNNESLLDTRVYTMGASGRVTLRQGLPIQSSVDYMLYRNDPNVNVVDWWHDKYVAKKFSWSISGEFNYLVQHLEDVESNTYGETTLQPAWAGAVQLKFKYDYLRAQVIGLMRNVEYILQNAPSLEPFVAIPEEGVSTTPEYFVAATIDYYIESAHLMPYITGGIQFPATYRIDDPLTVQVIRNPEQFDRLPQGFDAVPIYQVRLGVQWDLSEMFAILANLQYARDANLTRLDIDPSGLRETTREFQDPDQLGCNIMARARF